MSATVLRSRFGYIFPKMLSYLSFNRQDGAKLPVAIQLYNRVVSTASAGGVLMTTPESIKSLFLKFVELQLDNADLGIQLPAPSMPVGNRWFGPNELLGVAPGWSTPQFALNSVRVVGCLDVEAHRLGAVLRMELSFALPLPRDGVKLMSSSGEKVDGHIELSLCVKPHRKPREGERLHDLLRHSHRACRAFIKDKGMEKNRHTKWGDSAVILYAPAHQHMEGAEGFLAFLLIKVVSSTEGTVHERWSEPIHMVARRPEAADEDEDGGDVDADPTREPPDGALQRQQTASLLGRVLKSFGPDDRGICIMDEVGGAPSCPPVLLCSCGPALHTLGGARWSLRRFSVHPLSSCGPALNALGDARCD